MALSPGTRLGQYEVITTIGAGGMGEVFRARDTKLHRDVALKILPDSFVHDADRLARFEREAQVLASLNHQHIAAIYGVEESESVKALVLELVDGVTLAERIASGPVPLDELIPTAQQIVEALEGAHSRGIVHRDLKPANIKIRSDGTVKVLDFGLAKALDPATSNADPLESPTITARATQMGTILGTAAYMAPEQAKGKPVDKRADIWAFGCVLYEMLTGRRAFSGEDVSDTMALVLTKEPEWSALPPNVPAPLARLVRRCLQKDPKRRLADIGDARLELEDAASAEVAPMGPSSAAVPRWRLAPWILAAAIGLTLLVAIVLWAPWRSQRPRGVVRLSTHIGAGVSLAPVTGGSSVVVSPKGDVLVFSAGKERTSRPSLWVRRLDQLTAVELAGTEGAVSPFVSPDGHWIGFFSTDKRLKKIAVTGGAVATLATAPIPRGAHWAEDDTIVFTPDRADTPVFRIPAAGGTPEPITSLGPNEATHRNPSILPGGKALLYTAHSSTSGFDAATIMVKPLPNGAPRAVVGGYQARYVRTGHLVFMREGALYAVPFDVKGLKTTGQPVPVVEGISASTLTGAAQVDVASDGTLVYVTGQEAAPEGPILWLNKNGTTTPLRGAPVITLSLQFSPDGRRLALDRYDGRQWDVCTYDWTRDTLSPITDDPSNEQRPVWTPDGARISFASRRAENNRVTYNLYWRRADGSGDVQRLTQNPNQQNPGSWHPSAKFFAFTELNPESSWDVMILPMEGDAATGWKPGTPSTFLNTRFTELEPTFSPDGRLLAYQSDESGRHEIYVRPFPGPGGREQISSGGGTHPQWSRQRPELVYLADGKVMAASYSIADGTFRSEKPRPWSPAEIRPRTGPVNRSVDLHPDGERVAFSTVSNDDAAGPRDHVVLVLNFADELRRRVPASGR